MAVDFLVINQNLYAFNYCFEQVFDMQKTLATVKTKAIEKIMSTNSMSNSENFKIFASQYKSPRTFITLHEDRLKRVCDKRSRGRISAMLHILLDDNGLFVISDNDIAIRFIKYLCFKIFQDSETNDILEGNTINKMDIS